MARIDIEPRELLRISVEDTLHGWYGGNKTHMARAAGVSPRTIGRAVEGNTDHTAPIVHNLIRVAGGSLDYQKAAIQEILGPEEAEIFSGDNSAVAYFKELGGGVGVVPPIIDSFPAIRTPQDKLKTPTETVIIKP